MHKYLLNSDWIEKDGFWIDPWKGKLWEYKEAVRAQLEYDLEDISAGRMKPSELISLIYD